MATCVQGMQASKSLHSVCTCVCSVQSFTRLPIHLRCPCSQLTLPTVRRKAPRITTYFTIQTIQLQLHVWKWYTKTDEFNGTHGMPGDIRFCVILGTDCQDTSQLELLHLRVLCGSILDDVLLYKVLPILHHYHGWSSWFMLIKTWA